LRDQIGHAFLGGEIVNKINYSGTLGLNGLARFRERDRIAAVQKQSDIGRREFFGDRSSNPAARTSDENSFTHVRRRVKRLFFVSHNRNRANCWFTRLSIFDQRAQTMFSPLDEIF